MKQTILGLIWYIIFFLTIGSAIYFVKSRRDWSFSRSYGHVMSRIFYYFSTVGIYIGLFFATFGGLNLLVGVNRHAMSIPVGLAVSLLSYLFRCIGKYWIESEQQRSD